MIELKLYKSRWKAVILMSGCSIFVAGGWWTINSGGPLWIGLMSIGFFGLGLPIGLFQLFDRRPHIILNEVGVFDRTAHHDFINWEIIQEFCYWSKLFCLSIYNCCITSLV